MIWKKVDITSQCPSCKEEWSREESIEYDEDSNELIVMPGILGLTICPKCDTGELATIEFTERYKDEG